MKIRLVAYGVVAFGVFLVLNRMEFDFDRTACVRRIRVDSPWTQAVLSPDGRHVARITPEGRAQVLRVDGAQHESLFEEDSPMKVPDGRVSATRLTFNAQGTHLAAYNDNGFRVIDLSSRRTWNFTMPEPPPESESESLSDVFNSETTRPFDSSAGTISQFQLSNTGRYVALRFDYSPRLALLEIEDGTYGFRRWIENAYSSIGTIVFAGDDSALAAVATGSDQIRFFTLPSGQPIEVADASTAAFENGTAVGAARSGPRFAFSWNSKYTSLDAGRGMRIADLQSRTFSELLVAPETGAERCFLPDSGGPLVYPVAKAGAPVDGIAMVDPVSAKVETYSLVHDRWFARGERTLYCAVGLGAEERLLRLVTAPAEGGGGFDVTTVDLAQAAELTESRRRSRNLAITTGLFASFLVGLAGLEFFIRLPRRLAQREAAAVDALFIACDSGDGATAGRLLQGKHGRRRAQIRNAKGFTSLMVAAGKGHLAVVNALLDAGAEIDAVDDREKGTSLLYACLGIAESSSATAIALIRRGARTDLRAKSGSTAAQMAAERGLTAVLAEIAAVAPAALALGDRDQVTPLYSAAEAGHTACVELCLKHVPATALLQRTSDGATAAYVASFKGNTAALTAILRTSPDSVRIPRPNGYLPATIAALKGHTACLEAIAAVAPDTFEATIADENHVTAAHLAAQNDHPDSLAVLARHAPATLLKPRDKDGVTPALMAAYKGNHRCLEVVARYVPDALAVRDSEGRLPAFLAAQNNHVEALRVLLAAAPTTLSDNASGTPAFIAAQQGSAEAVRYLLSVVPESFDVLFEGNNPAHVAATLLREEIYTLLAEQRPSLLTTPNKADRTPPQLLAEAKQTAAEKERAKSTPAASGNTALGGLLVLGVGFKPGADITKDLIVKVCEKNPIAGFFLLGLTCVSISVDTQPSEFLAVQLYQHAGRTHGWNTASTPTVRSFRLADGRVVMVAYPPIV